VADRYAAVGRTSIDPVVFFRLQLLMFFEDILERARSYGDTVPYRKALRKRQVWVEPLFGEAKDWHASRGDFGCAHIREGERRSPAHRRGTERKEAAHLRS
jgi:hypothetical protein